MGLLELPRLIVGCFLRGGFGSNHDPDDTPMNWFSIIGVFVLVAWLILGGLIMAQVIRRDVTGQHCAVKGRATSVLTYLDESHDALSEISA